MKPGPCLMIGIRVLGIHTSSIVGVGTLTPRHRLLIAGMTLLVELQHKMIRQEAMYFSIVLLRACCASFVRRSTSVRMTTGRKDIANFTLEVYQYRRRHNQGTTKNSYKNGCDLTEEIRSNEDIYGTDMSSE